RARAHPAHPADERPLEALDLILAGEDVVRALVLADAIVELGGDPGEVGLRVGQELREDALFLGAEAHVALYLLEQRFAGHGRRSCHQPRDTALGTPIIATLPRR